MSIIKYLLTGIIAAFSITTGLLLFNLFTAETAQAAGISCGQIQCSLGSEQSAHGGGSGEDTGGGSGNHNSGGGSTTPPKYKYDYKACVNWWTGEFTSPEDGSLWNSSSVYPTDSRAWDCNFWGSRWEYEYGDMPVCHPVNGIAANGRYDAISLETGAVEFYWCVYPFPEYVQPVVKKYYAPTGGEGTFYLAATPTSAKTYGAFASVADSTGWRDTGYGEANAANPPSLNQVFNARTVVKNNQPAFGYYRLDWRIKWAEYEVTSWHAWLNKPSKAKLVRTWETTESTPYTYGCNLNPALAKGIVAGAEFDASACDSTSWQCDISGDIRVNGTHNDIQVMRDGQHLDVKMPSFSVSGDGVRNITAKKTLTSVDTQKVSPVNMTDPNAKKQYFDSSWVWNSWSSYTTDPQWLAFYWSSDAGKDFSFTQKYKFTGDFLVNTQGSLDGGTTRQWVTDTTDCGVTKASGDIQVVRSVSSP